MPKTDGVGQGKSKPEMIREVLSEQPNVPAPAIRSAVWERFGAEVTTQEIAQVRKKLRQAEAPEVAVAARPESPPRTKPVRERPSPPKESATMKREPAKKAPAGEQPRKKVAPADFRAKDFDSAEVTVKQLSAILEVAEEVGGLRKLQEALRTMMVLRDKVGSVDEHQLAFALDFLARLMGGRR